MTVRPDYVHALSADRSARGRRRHGCGMVRGALGSLGCREAVLPLLELRSRLVATRVPPDWPGPVALRRALSDLGALSGRRPPCHREPEGAARRHGHAPFQVRRPHHGHRGPRWGSARNSYLQAWRIGDDGRLYWVQSDREEWAYDWSAPWSDNVAAARAVARANAAKVVPQPDFLPPCRPNGSMWTTSRPVGDLRLAMQLSLLGLVQGGSWTVPASMICPAKVRCSTMAAQSRGCR